MGSVSDYGWGMILTFVIMFVGIVLGVWWLLWQLYLYVASSFWPGHGAISEPSYLQFVAIWVLIGCVASVFKSSKKGD